MSVEGYRIVEAIGVGGFSVVYRAEQLGFGREVALKVFNVNGSEARRVEREAVALGVLSDVPNVVPVHHIAATADGRPVIVMALMDRSLGEAVRTGGIELDDARLCQWLTEVSSALDAAHGRKIFHRDIKPENVLLDANGVAYLADFGIAGVDTMESSTTTSFSFSPPYASPERLTGEEVDVAASDIYSLGATFFALLCGQAPFGTSTDGGVHGLISRVVTQPLARATGIPEPVQRVFDRVLSKVPGERHTTAGMFASELQAALGFDRPHSAAPSTGVVDRDPVDHRAAGDPEPGDPADSATPPAAASVAGEVAPGWFEDPWGERCWRWWDGSAWTDHRVALDGNLVPDPAGAGAVPAPGPGWYPDPVGRFELRWWSGVAWTGEVSAGGTVGVDPLG